MPQSHIHARNLTMGATKGCTDTKRDFKNQEGNIGATEWWVHMVVEIWNEKPNMGRPERAASAQKIICRKIIQSAMTENVKK